MARQHLLTGKGALDPAAELRLFMECASAISKTDPEAIPKGANGEAA